MKHLNHTTTESSKYEILQLRSTASQVALSFTLSLLRLETLSVSLVIVVDVISWT
jgi:hypothetical protein